jgi:hypothetical protein
VNESLKQFQYKENEKNMVTFNIIGDIIIRGDVKIEFKDYDEKNKKMNKFFHFWFNTNMIVDNKLILKKHEIDGKCAKDMKKHEDFPIDFSIVLKFDLIN